MDMLGAAIAAGIILLVLDAIWLGLIAKTWIHERIGHLQRDKPLRAPAGVFYVLYAVALAYFAITPALPAGDWLKAALTGGFLGLVAYGTYDLTNLATLDDWPLSMTAGDMAWGVFASAVTSGGSVLLISLFS